MTGPLDLDMLEAAARAGQLALVRLASQGYPDQNLYAVLERRTDEFLALIARLRDAEARIDTASRVHEEHRVRLGAHGPCRCLACEMFRALGSPVDTGDDR